MDAARRIRNGHLPPLWVDPTSILRGDSAADRPVAHHTRTRQTALPGASYHSIEALSGSSLRRAPTHSLEPPNDPNSDPLLKGRGMISPHVGSTLAQAKVDDVRRAADSHRLARLASRPSLASAAERSVTLRFGSPADEKGIARLAELDSWRPPPHPVLLAEVDGQLLAALALSDGSVVANPFHRTADLIDLLRARARQFDGSHRRRRSFRLPTWSRLRVAT